MNPFLEHHKDSIRFHYRCFDRILLNGLIQPFQRPERVVGFFDTYRKLYPVCRDTLRGIADRFQFWLHPWAAKRNIPILDAPKGRRDEFVELFQGGKTRRGRRRAEGARTGPHHDRHRRQGHQPLAPAIRRALGRSVQLLRQRSAMGPHVRAHVPLLAILRADLPQPASLAGHSDARGRHRLPPMLECLHALAPNPNACKSLPTS